VSRRRTRCRCEPPSTSVTDVVAEDPGQSGDQDDGDAGETAGGTGPGSRGNQDRLFGGQDPDGFHPDTEGDGDGETAIVIGKLDGTYQLVVEDTRWALVRCG
jgi:hypothetical protein